MWTNELKNMRELIPDQLLQLDVGGLYFPKVSKNLMTSVPGSALAAMFSGRHELPKENSLGKFCNGTATC